MAEVNAALRALAGQALAEWDLDGAHLEPIGISENASFRVDAPDKRYVLRIHRPGYHTLVELESEQVWTAALREAGLDVPVPVRTRDDRGYVTLPFDGGERHVGLLEWVDGELMGRIMEREPSTFPEHFRAIGRIAAAIHNQSAAWTVPNGFQRHRFDVEGFVGDRAFWGPFWDIPQLTAEQRDVLGKARLTIADELSRLDDSAKTFSLIHADLHPHNVVVGEPGLHLIDFDDSGFGWHHYELAVVLYRYRGLDGFDEMQAALIEGYRERRPFTDADVAKLRLFFLIRTLVHLGWRADRPEHGTDLTEEIEYAMREAMEWMD
ncbi:MAG: phosphotransferase [Gammaproteobacteria bacterium]|nr:phosphotransferase [Gammaproteobacteria bacterium]